MFQLLFITYTIYALTVLCIIGYVKTDFFLVVDTLYGKTYQISNSGQVAALGSSQSAVPRHATGYNPATGEIIWFDSQADAIKQLFFNGTSERVILSVKGKIFSKNFYQSFYWNNEYNYAEHMYLYYSLRFTH